VDNIKTSVREIGSGGMDWKDLAQDRDQWRALVNTVMNFRVPYNAGKFLSSRIGRKRWWLNPVFIPAIIIIIIKNELSPS
jgi:hypothetical protein